MTMSLPACGACQREGWFFAEGACASWLQASARRVWFPDEAVLEEVQGTFTSRTYWPAGPVTSEGKATGRAGLVISTSRTGLVWKPVICTWPPAGAVKRRASDSAT